MNATHSRTADKFVVRLPNGMREQVAEVARRNHRSMNSEIIDRLLQNVVPTQDDIQEVLHLVRHSPLAQSLAAVGA